MKSYRNCLLLLFLFSLIGAGSGTCWADQANDAYQTARADYYNLKNSSRKQLYRENWLQVIDNLALVQKRFPDSKRAPDALYLAGKASQGLYRVSRVGRDARLAIDYFLRLHETYPHDNLADDGLVLVARLYEEVLKEPAEAYRYYAKVVKWYPDGDMFGTAQGKARQLAAHAPKQSAMNLQMPQRPFAKKLTDVRHWSDDNYTRVVFDFSDKVSYSFNHLAAEPKAQTPSRIYLDIENLELDGDRPFPSVSDAVISEVRTGQPKPGVTRFVLDLHDDVEFRVFPLENPFRIVVDVNAVAAASAPGQQPQIRSLPPAADQIASILDLSPKDAPPLIQIPDRNPSGGLRRIVVDAGHGGKDPGAIGPNQVMEKDVTLAIARQLSKRLRDELHCEVIMTRSGDTYLPLQERTALANRVDADLFISIHANASENRSVYGVETYYLNFSKNDQAVAVAARENGMSLREVGNLELILFDLMANSKINESSRLAAEIQNALVQRLSRKYSKVKNLGVRPGPFHVLLGATMPSVLVETAFISNRREEKRLTSPEYHQQAADAIIAGVRNYAKAFKLIAAK
jgi:N-acetylmuramoyl-L-alanine amidase